MGEAQDSSFGTNGVVTTGVGDGRDTARGLVIQADGKIVVTGYSDIGAENDVVLLRYYGDTIEVNEPELLTNYHTGAPGTYFTLAAQGFPANSVGTLSVNGHTVGTVSIDANGETTFTLSTMNATAGIYTTTLSVNPEASMSLMIDPNAPLRDREDFDSPIFEFPVGSTADYEVYLPSIAKE